MIGRYIRDLIRTGRRNPVVSRKLAAVMSSAVDKRVDNFVRYMSNMAEKMHHTSVRYWRQYGVVDASCNVPTAEHGGMEYDRSEQQSLYVFPGRPNCRPDIAFDKVDHQDCSKNYFKGQGTVPSFLTVQCACAHPKLLGFVILKQNESISAALSTVLTHFPVPPRTVWYDNACNLYDSAITRIPWYLRWTRFMVDRFHYIGHTCSNMYNGDLQIILDEDRTVAAEVINSLIDNGTTHIAYLEGRNVIPFMKLLFAQVNGLAHVKDFLNRSDVEDEDLLQLYRRRFKCVCDFCVRESTDNVPPRDGNDDSPFVDGIAVWSRDNLLVPLRSVGPQLE